MQIQSYARYCMIAVALWTLGATGCARACGPSRYLYDVNPYDINPKHWAVWRETLPQKDWKNWCGKLTMNGYSWWRESMGPKNWEKWKEAMGPKDIALWDESTMMLSEIKAREEQQAQAEHDKRAVRKSELQTNK